jgi:Spy/CpxP family protein refolding chaperone
MLLAAAVPASAQLAEDQPWWKVPAIRDAIVLTSRQAEQIEAIYRESLPMRRNLRRQLTAQQKRVAEMLSAGLYDDERAQAAVERLFIIDSKRNVARVLMIVRMYRTLTPTQRTRLQDLSARLPGDASADTVAGLLPRRE